MNLDVTVLNSFECVHAKEFIFWSSDIFPCVQIEDDLLHPNPALEKRKHKLKRLVQSPNSYFMDVKCPGCFNM